MASALPKAPLARSQSARAGFSPTATTTSPDSSSARARLTTGNSAGATQRSERERTESPRLDADAAIPRIIARPLIQVDAGCRGFGRRAGAAGVEGTRSLYAATDAISPDGAQPQRVGGRVPRGHLDPGRTRPSAEATPPTSFFELMNAAQFGKENHPEDGDGDRADAAEQHRRNRAEERGDQARLEGAQLVRGSGEQRVHGADAAAHRVRRPDLNERGPDDHADHVRRAENGEGDEREREAGGEAEHDRGRPEDHDGTKEGGPDSPAQRIAGE